MWWGERSHGKEATHFNLVVIYSVIARECTRDRSNPINALSAVVRLLRYACWLRSQ